MLSKITFAIVMIMSLALSGCGDLLGQKVVKRELDGSQFAVECELDMNSFSEIMEKNIKSQIMCLGENLNLFIKIVKSGKPGYLSRVQLEQYLANHRPDVKPEMVKALKAIFDLGHLITGEDPNFISKQTVDKVINFMVVFNREAARVFPDIFLSETRVKYAAHKYHREVVSSANKVIIQSLRTIYNPNRDGKTHQLNIITLLDSFSTEETRETIDKARKILFMKKVLLGGDSEVITHHELEKMILNFDHLLLVGLDIVRYQYLDLLQEDLISLLKRDVNDLYEIVTQGPLNNRDGELMFTMNEAYEAVKVFVDKEDFDVEKFKVLIGEVKKIVMKGTEDQVMGAELKRLFTEAKKVLQTGSVFHRIYDKFKVQLDKPDPVEHTINFDEYRYTYPEHQAELDIFERVAKKYRFMKGEFLSSYYQRGFERNQNAMFEIYLLEYALKLVFEAYGSPSPNSDSVGGYSIDKDQMQRLVVKFEKELVELDLMLPGKAISTADNISLLGTLFQYQSDKNKVMDVNEAAEFGVSLLSSLNIADDMFEYMEDKKCQKDEFDRFEPACFKKYFWEAYCANYKSNFPLMFQSMNTPAKCADFVNTSETNTVLFKAISAARTCNYYTDGNKEEIPYSKGDFMTILLAIMHAETTILRWDVVNVNNYLDPDEVMNAYEIYSPALDGFLEDKNAIIKKFKKQIYQYMIKYEAVPDEEDMKSVWKFIKFLLSFDKKAPAKRRTIVSLLDVIGQQNAKLQTGPKFDCNSLRDPENIPEADYSGYFSKKKPIASLSAEEIKALLVPVADYLNNNWNGDKESLRQELITLTEELATEEITRIKDIRTKNVRKLFTKIADNKTLMNNINLAFNEGPEVQRIALALTMILTQN